ncbi:MAG TPA: ABC transporter permease [Acidimicrobiales bacterium]|nr:ABC transporter permease [Acidimicrobiales bacterium]
MAIGLDPNNRIEPTARSGGRWSQRTGAALWRRPWLRGVLTLSPPLAWFLVIYLASLGAMLVTAFFSTNSLTGNIIYQWTWSNFQQIFTQSVYGQIILRTLLMAIVVTLTDAAIALPFAFYLAKVATHRWRRVLLALTLLPLWGSYLAKVYAWINILSNNGVLPGVERWLHLPQSHLAYSNVAMWIVFSYLWLPFMVVPIYGAFERVPDSLLEASSDLGAGVWFTFRRVLFPLILPGIIAGSIFTFSLTLGDFITPLLIGGSSSYFIGNAVYNSAIQGGNLPFAAALAFVSILIMGIYLFLARLAGAFDAL